MKEAKKRILAGDYNTVKVFKARNRKVRVVQLDDGTSFVLKKITRDRCDVDQLALDIDTYHSELNALGVRVPEKVSLFESKEGELFELSPLYGETLEEALAVVDNEATRQLVEQMLYDVVGPVFAGPRTKSGAVRTGLDVVLSNFVRGVDGRIRYIDLCPPKITKNERHLLEVLDSTDRAVEDVGIFRHFRIDGLSLVLLVQLCRTRPDRRPLFKQVLKDFLLKRELQEVIEFLEVSPGFTLPDDLSSDFLRKVVNELGFREIYFLRDLACELTYRNLMSKEDLNHFFELSHFKNEPIPEEKIVALKAMIIAAVPTREAVS